MGPGIKGHMPTLLGAKYLTTVNHILFSMLTPLLLKPVFRHWQITPNSVTHPFYQFPSDMN